MKEPSLVTKIDYLEEYQKLFNGEHIFSLYQDERDYQDKEGVLDWLPTDTEERYKQNLKNPPTGDDRISVYGAWGATKLHLYDKYPIKYHFDEDKCRYSTKQKIDRSKPVTLCLGDSFTVGVGQHFEHTWPYFYSYNTKAQVINAGISGYGIEHSYIRLIQFINKYKVTEVLHYQNLYPRYFTLPARSLKEPRPHLAVYNPLHMAATRFGKEYSTNSLNKHVLCNPAYMAYNHIRTLRAIRDICTESNIRYFYMDYIPTHYKIKKENTYPPPFEIYPARDLLHFDNIDAFEVSKTFLKAQSTNPNGHINMSSLSPDNTGIISCKSLEFRDSRNDSKLL